MEYPRTPWIFFPGGRNIQGLLGCQAVAKACSVVALLVPDDPFCLVFSRCSQAPPPFLRKMLFWGPSGGLKERLKNALEKNRHGDATPRMGAFHRSSPDGVKGAVCHNIKNNNFFIERKHVISGGDHGKSKSPPRGGGPPPRGPPPRKTRKT